MQDAVIRLMTDRASPEGFELYPDLGASLSRFIGAPMSRDTLREIDRAGTNALVMDKRFPQATQVKAMPVGPTDVKIYVLVPTPEGLRTLSPPLDFSTVRGVTLKREEIKSPWIWRRGQASIQQSYKLWRAWIGSAILWRLSPGGLVTTSATVGSLDDLGTFSDPFLLYRDKLLFCSRGATDQIFIPQAQTDSTGWKTRKAIQIAGELPSYQLPDGIWADSETSDNIVVIIHGETAGYYNYQTGFWYFRSIRVSG